MALPYSILDVFTDTPFLGNPLAVVTILPGVSLAQAQKQRIAKEFNLSETTFVHDIKDHLSSDQRHFDIFTPLAELPFAGHPTIGTAVFLREQGVRTLVAKAGRINIEEAADNALRAAIPYDVRLHQSRLSEWQPKTDETSQNEVAKAEGGAPLFSVVKGMTFALIELPSLELLSEAQVGTAPELPAELLDDGWQEGWITRRYYFVRLGSEKVGETVVHRIRTRMIKRTMEDPATGSAACALAGYLSLHKLDDPSISFEITQGVEMGRESTILMDVGVSRDATGERKLESMHLGGKAVPVMSGTIKIPQ